MEIKREKINQYVYTCLFMGYLIFNAVLLAMHEPWRDEANVWLMGRELSPIQLLQEIKYQGHPCLWYLLVMPFAKMGFSLRTIEIISFLVMSASAAVFIWKAPFHSITQAACLFSPVFTYFYSCIARNYCLIALLLILLAWQYPKRNERSILYGLLLGLMVQADTIAIGDPESVPAGKYAKEILTNLGVYNEVEKKASLGASVTEVLSWVAEGSADAGIVYATDAQTENTNGDDKEVEVVATAEDSMMQTPVVYPVGVVSASTHKDEAKAFEDFLQTDEAKAILEKAGFTINK